MSSVCFLSKDGKDASYEEADEWMQIYFEYEVSFTYWLVHLVGKQMYTATEKVEIEKKLPRDSK